MGMFEHPKIGSKLPSYRIGLIGDCRSGACSRSEHQMCPLRHLEEMRNIRIKQAFDAVVLVFHTL